MKTLVRKSFMWWCAALTFIGLVATRIESSWFLPPKVVPRDSWKHVVWNMPAGWSKYLADVLPRVKPDWPGIALALLCLLLTAFGVHGIGRKLASGWSWRATTGCLLVPVILFGIILSSGGAVSRIRELYGDRMIEMKFSEPLELQDYP